MFSQQLVSETVPSLAQGSPGPTLADTDMIRRLLEKHSGFAQFKITLPGVVTFSPGAAKVNGYPSGSHERTLKGEIDAYVAEDRRRIIGLISEAVREQRGFRLTARRLVGKSVRIIETIGDVLVRNSRVVEIFGLTRDVTALVEREALGISRARLIRRLVDDMPVPVVVLDKTLCVQACSVSWAQSYGLNGRAEALGRPLNKLAELSNEARTAIVKAMSGETARLVMRGHSPEDGRAVMRSCAVIPWHGGADASGGVLMVMGDAQVPYATAEIADRALGRGARMDLRAAQR